MLTIQNFGQKLNDFIKRDYRFRNDWKITHITNSTDSMPKLVDGLEHYSVYVDNKEMFMEIRLWRNMDEDFMTEHDANEIVYKISFVDVHNHHIIYEHYISKNFLWKPPMDFMVRMVDIICDIVIEHPNNIYKGVVVPF